MKTRHLWLLLCLVLGLRVATLGLYPLTDTTEARYAEMARKMLETGNWLTPMFDVGVPFWGKPPLSFWLSAWPMALAGVSEFTARLGPLVAALFTLSLLWLWPVGSEPSNAGTIPRHQHALCAAIVFLSTPLGFVASGAVMTDMAMVAGTTLSMLAFWRAWTMSGGARWGWLFFGGQAIGLLAKGPVAVVLSGVAISLFMLEQMRRAGLKTSLVHLWDSLPWLRGLALTALLVLPWYLLAEQATPGFLRYFIIGEHWSRFTQSGWKGDLYGVAHAQPKGRIWLFGLLSTLPWVLLAVGWKLRRHRPAPPLAVTERDYLLAWMLSPALFFTLSGNILPAYVLPGLPALALLIAGLWTARAASLPSRLLAVGAAVLTPLTFTGLVLFQGSLFEGFSEKSSLQHLPGPVTYLYERPASAVFYGRQQALLAKDDAAVQQALAMPAGHVALSVRKLGEMQAHLTAQGWQETARSKEFAVFAKRPG